MVLYKYKHDESRSGQVVIKNRMYNHNHFAYTRQQMDSLIGRKSIATGQHNTKCGMSLAITVQCTYYF